ncbi:hypothetical protein BJY01DRAFT_29406 [Aspergillus pseudoustus]|uniref:Uncharacterized protein n=1 Tax=Aspergillus pseudoustus TaxID=1810923 RepID=A0ABR4JHJ8_9EURO
MSEFAHLFTSRVPQASFGKICIAQSRTGRVQPSNTSQGIALWCVQASSSPSSAHPILVLRVCFSPE